MVLEGLRVPTFLGWISGVFFTCKPYGKISFHSYFHPFTLYALVINGMVVGLWLDFYQDAATFIVSKPLTSKIFYLSSMTGVHVINTLMRLIFCISAKRIAEMLKLVKDLMSPVKPRDLRCTWTRFLILFWGIFIFHGINAGAMAFYFKNSEFSQSTTSMYFPNQVRPWWYFLIFFIFATLPISCCIYFTFTFIFVTTFCILCTFEQFCEVLMEIGLEIQIDSRSLVSTQQDSTFAIDMEFTADDHDVQVSFVKNGSPRNVKSELLARFDRIKELFDLYDSIVGPMVLCVLIRNVVVVINEASSVFLNPNEFIITQRGCSTFVLLGDILQFCILELGSWTQRRMNKWKMDLEKMIILMATSLEKDHLSDVVHQVCKWNWQMSASGFFNINRQLMSGIVATMLSYIVILFQLRVSEIPLVSTAAAATECGEKNFTDKLL